MVVCQGCGKQVTGIHYEAMNPGFQGGSKSFVAVATPCNHIVSAVPMTWESLIKQNLKETLNLKSALDHLQHAMDEIVLLLRIQK